MEDIFDLQVGCNWVMIGLVTKREDQHQASLLLMYSYEDSVTLRLFLVA
jgi:hypothetical protein